MNLFVLCMHLHPRIHSFNCPVSLFLALSGPFPSSLALFFLSLACSMIDWNSFPKIDHLSSIYYCVCCIFQDRFLCFVDLYCSWIKIMYFQADTPSIGTWSGTCASRSSATSRCIIRGIAEWPSTALTICGSKTTLRTKLWGILSLLRWQCVSSTNYHCMCKRSISSIMFGGRWLIWSCVFCLGWARGV